MGGEASLVAVAREPDQRVEVLGLVEMEQYVAVMQVLDLDRRQPGRGIRRRRVGGQQRGQQQGPRHRGHSQTRTTNSGCSLRRRSLIFSSTYCAPTPLSMVSVAPRL